MVQCSLSSLSATELVPACRKVYRSRDMVQCSNISLSAENGYAVLKNSAEHTIVYFVQTVLVNATSPYRAQYGL